jgi:hypothetical protein
MCEMNGDQIRIVYDNQYNLNLTCMSWLKKNVSALMKYILIKKKNITLIIRIIIVQFDG